MPNANEKKRRKKRKQNVSKTGEIIIAINSTLFPLCFDVEKEKTRINKQYKTLSLVTITCGTFLTTKNFVFNQSYT